MVEMKSLKTEMLRLSLISRLTIWCFTLSVITQQGLESSDGREFKTTSARFSEGIHKFDVAHSSGNLHTRLVKISKVK